jgi:hypothetical protein
MTLKLVPPVYEWQTWKDGYQPSDEQLGAMGDDEYEARGGELRASLRHAGKKGELCERGRRVRFSLADDLNI